MLAPCASKGLSNPKGKRLDVFLSGCLEGLSRSRIKTFIEQGHILVNNKPTKPGYMLKGSDSIAISIPPVKKPVLTAAPIKLDILFEDHDIIIINKPCAMTVHHGAGKPAGTLCAALLYHTDNLSTVGGPLRPGIVHRLDKDTSGVMVCAKTDKAHLALAKEFEKHTIKRRYHALVWGNVMQDAGRIDLPLGRSISDRKKISTKARRVRTALTEYRVIRRYKGLTLVEATPYTGRTHQIRVHLSAIGHPIVGDQTYGRKKIPAGLYPMFDSAVSKMKRQCLHAKTLGIIHPTKGNYMEFEAPYPADMASLIKILDNECA
ncbi:MAG: RluA family pseudouridine synthase [Deltaproteobacteria bacterium]|nr:RluA family pseudouridine synthase [Deltaproteobacteria bacterium]